MNGPYLVKVLDGSWQEGSDELEGSRGKTVGCARIGIDVITRKVSHVLQKLKNEQDWLTHVSMTVQVCLDSL